MNRPVHSKTFASGNSVAVQLPESFDIPPGMDVEVIKTGDQVVIKLVRNTEEDKAEAKRKLLAMLEELDALPLPPRPQKRERLEFPDRPGL
jgi:virulence-associated protein VagC